jgi:hypothetical protein
MYFALLGKIMTAIRVFCSESCESILLDDDVGQHCEFNLSAAKITIKDYIDSPPHLHPVHPRPQPPQSPSF